jgi:ribosomal protein L11 methyltransferase
VHVPHDAAEDVAAWLVEAGAGGVVHLEEALPSEARLDVYGESARALRGLAAKVRARLLAERVEGRARVNAAPASVGAWETEWMRHLVPVPVSAALTLVPTTWAGALPERGRVVWLEPAMAFGFGEHPTTRLAARAIERLCLAGRTRSVLDVGTGSGVLAVIAALRGATRVVGIDLDPRAVAAARGNAARNGVARRCRFSGSPASRLRGQFDVVVANVDLRTLGALAGAMPGLLVPGGKLLLTGVLAEDAEDLERVYRAVGFTRFLLTEEAGWVLCATSVTPGPGQAGPRALRWPPGTARRTTRKPRSR